MSRTLALARLSIVGLVIGLGQPGLAQETSMRSISGSVSYPQKIALPPEAELHVAVRGRFGTGLGETQVPAGGRQVPLDFTLDIPSDLSGQLDAAIRMGGAPRWILRDLALPSGADPLELGMIRVEPVMPLAFVTGVQCQDTEVEIGILDEDMVLRVEGRDIALRQSVSASGERYEGVSDPETVVWSKGDEITIRLEGRDLPECRQTLPPGQQPYRARGIEPGWHVDLGDGTATITADYGEITREAPRPEAIPEPGGYLFDMPEAGASLRIEERLCRDAATGMPYPDIAALSLDERRLTGCGGDPLDLLTGEAWRITSIGGTAPVEPERVSINFLAPARVAGSTGCNRFVGGFTLTGEGLHFGAIGSTLMACPDELMAQERDLLDAIEQVTRFDMTDTGALQLIGGPRDEVLIEAARP